MHSSRLILALSFCFALCQAVTAGTLAHVKERGYVKCGVSQGLAGFSSPDPVKGWKGIDVDLCRAVAAAALGSADKVKFTPLSAKERFTALQSGEIDILSRNTTWTMSRDTALGLDFAGILFYDGQGFMVPAELGVSSAKELDGAVICTNSGTTTELNIADYFKANKLAYEIVTFENTDEVIAAYEAKRCDVFSSDSSALAAQRLKLSAPKSHIILPEVISKEPLGPVVRQGDDEWANIVRWTLYAMLNAEELHVSSTNLKDNLHSVDPNVKRLLGIEGDLGKRLGLDNRWAYHIIAEVGNYQELYERNLGLQTPLKIPRKANALWRDGGLHYAPPMR